MFDAEGANAALVKAREAGKLRYIGFTGHKDPHIHLHTLDVAESHGFTFDAVQMPLNVMDAHYRSFGQIVLPRARRQRHRRAGDEADRQRHHSEVPDGVGRPSASATR